MCRDSTIFLIANDAAVQDALSISLSMEGFNIEVYPSGKAFVDAYQRNRPGCLLMDLSVPELEGLALQKALTRLRFQLPIIFLTDRSSQLEAQHAMLTSGCSLVEKPFSRATLLKIIRGVLLQDCDNRRNTNYKSETVGSASGS